MKPLVSIVIPVYKTEQYLEKSVVSAISQIYDNKEIILVDDGSPDNCPYICDGFADKYENISVIHKENGGLSSARNAGIVKASGKYILFLDSDDTLADDAVRDMVDIAEDEKSSAVIPSCYYKLYPDGRKELAYHFGSDMFCADPKRFTLEVIIGQGRAMRSTAVLYHLDLIKKHDVLFSLGKISEDFFFNMDFMQYADKLSTYNKPSLFNLKRDGSISSSFHKNFFDTILEMDNKVVEFISSVDKKAYTDSISGKRETLLYRNLLVYTMVVMGQRMPYKTKRDMCVKMFNNKIFDTLDKKNISVPYFNGGLKKLYMKIAFKLILQKHYNAVCLISGIASGLKVR